MISSAAQGRSNRSAQDVLLLALVILLLQFPAFAQVSPSFSPQPAMLNSGSTPTRGVEIVSYTSNPYPSVLYGFYVDSSHRVNWDYSLDGVNYPGQGVATDQSGSGFYFAECGATYGDSTCAASAINGPDGIYIAFVEGGTRYLDVVRATLIPGFGGVGFNFNLIHRETSVQMTSAPGLAIFNNKLMINYGTSIVPNQNNAGYVTVYDFAGNWSTAANGTFLPTKPGMAVFNGQLYEMVKQNNSNNHIEINRLDGNGINVPNSHYELNANYKTSAGITATVFQNNLIFAARDNGSGLENIYSSPDGVNWFNISYPNLLIGSSPGIALFNGGLATAFKANDSRYVLYASFASH